MIATCPQCGSNEMFCEIEYAYPRDRSIYNPYHFNYRLTTYECLNCGWELRISETTNDDPCEENKVSNA